MLFSEHSRSIVVRCFLAMRHRLSPRRTVCTILPDAEVEPADESQGQLALFSGQSAGPSLEESEVLTELRELDADRTTPMDALVALQRWRTRLAEGEKS